MNYENQIFHRTIPVKENNRDRSLFCLLVWGLSSHSRIFHSYGDVLYIKNIIYAYPEIKISMMLRKITLKY